MISLTARAERQIASLRKHYEKKQRPEAIWALINAIDIASKSIEADPAAGLAAPRPYPWLIRRGQLWTKAGSYWVAYSLTRPPLITAIFYDKANIPGRFIS